MTELTLAEIRARIAAKREANKPQLKKTGLSDNSVYRHWEIDEGKSVSLRFLKDVNNPDGYFWRERQMIKLPFNGVIGQPNHKTVIVQVPCIEMFGPAYKNACPIHNELRTWYKAKDKNLELLANKYWKKRSYLFQGFVRQSSLVEEEVPENPIRKFRISPQLFTIIESSLLDPEFGENLPTDHLNGVDFTVRKTSKGGHADYSTSGWARKETPLTDNELAAIEKYGLFTLSDALPKIPGDEELVVMLQMFQASVDGEAYDPDRWGSYYKPWGVQVAGSGKAHGDEDDDATPNTSVSPSMPTAPTVAFRKPQEVEEPVEAERVVIPATPTDSGAMSKEERMNSLLGKILANRNATPTAG